MENQLPLTSADLQRFIEAQQIEATILPLTEHTPTVPDAARALAVEPEQIIKSLVFLIRDKLRVETKSQMGKGDKSSREIGLRKGLTTAKS